MNKRNEKIVELIYEYDPSEKEVIIMKGKYKDGTFAERAIRILTTSEEEIKQYKAIVIDGETSYDKARKTMLKPIKENSGKSLEELMSAL